MDCDMRHRVQQSQRGSDTMLGRNRRTSVHVRARPGQIVTRAAVYGIESAGGRVVATGPVVSFSPATSRQRGRQQLVGEKI